MSQYRRGKRTDTNIQKRRRLEDLFRVGTDVHFNADGVVENEEDYSDDDIVVHVTPPDTLQREQALRDAQAAKHRELLALDDKESDAYMEAELLVRDLEPESMKHYIIEQQMSEFRARAIREVLSESEWKDIDSLRDGIRQWEEAGSPEDDEEWKPLLERDRMYGKQVKERLEEIMEGARESLDLLPAGELERRVRKRHTESNSNAIFMSEYENNMTYYACRDDEDHDVLFFDSVEDMRSAPEEVLIGLAGALAQLINDPREAKNSPRAVDGSQQSALSDAPETSELSTPEVQPA